MKENYNDMQEFLKNSMEQFSSSPSSDVWENLDSQLNVATPFYKKWFFWGVLAISLMLITLLGTTFQLYHSNQDLVSKSNTALEENQLLHHKIEQLKSQLSIAQNNAVVDHQSGADNETKLRTNSSIKQTEKVYTQYSNNIDNSATGKVLGLSQQSSVNSSGVRLPEIKDSPFSTNTNPGEYQTLTIVGNNFQEKNTAVVLVKEKGLKTNSIPPLTLSSLVHSTSRTSRLSINSMLPPLESSLKEKDSWTRKLELLSLLQNIKSSLSFDPSFETPKGWHWYKFGILTGVHTTWTDLGNQWDAGYTVGLSNEIILNKKLGLTFDFRYNSQQYRFQVNDSNFNAVSDYPRAPSAQSIEDIEVKSRYFDIPIGLSYSVPLSRKIKLRVNPAVAWQLYLPQKYEYDIGENVKLGNVEERYFLYFGSAHLDLAIERKLNADVAWRIGLWGEVGLIPLGIERRKIRMFGIKSAIIFGKS